MRNRMSPTHVARRATILAVVAFTLTACADDPAGPPRGPDNAAPDLGVQSEGQGGGIVHLGGTRGSSAEGVARAIASGSDTIPGEYIVVFNDDALTAEGLSPAAVAAQMVATHRGTLKFTYQHALKGFAAKLSDQGVAALRRDRRVAYIEPNQVMRTAVTQRMDAAGDPWGLDRIDQRSGLSRTYTYGATGAGVNVYIIDTGLQSSHLDFGGRARNVATAFGDNGEDCNGHGTHVAGTVGGRTWGVAKGARLLGVKILDCSGRGDLANFAAAADWVRANRINPAVANMSLQGPASRAVATAVNNLANSGVFVAVAAGNSNINACNSSPALAAAAFTTAASSKTDVRASFSNWGTCVDGYAPGVAVKSARLGGGAKYLDGTSMASPHVAGVAALYKHRFGNASSAAITNWIKSNATVNVIWGNISGTPNRLLFKSTL